MLEVADGRSRSLGVCFPSSRKSRAAKLLVILAPMHLGYRRIYFRAPLPIAVFLKETAHNCGIIGLPKGDKISKFGRVQSYGNRKDSDDRV
jgi:hypothetical protein